MLPDGTLAVIDIGTVTARLAISQLSGGHVTLQKKVSTICNLGEGVDKTRMLAASAIERVSSCVGSYVAEAKSAGAQAIACTLTSAARDAGNSSQLLKRLENLGIKPQVIPGEVEGRLTFLGVAQDFPGTHLLVADNGGGSTELACGRLDAAEGQQDAAKGQLDAAEGVSCGDAAGRLDAAGGRLDTAEDAALSNPADRLRMDLVRSTNVGCRRLTDRFLSRTDPPSPDDLREAHAFAAELFSPVVAELRELGASPERLVATGGTVTTLVAVKEALVPYDSSRVHLHTLTREDVASIEDCFARLTVAERAEVPGMQAKRAPVILAGIVAIGELMDQTGFAELTVSESDLLVGLTLSLASSLS